MKLTFVFAIILITLSIPAFTRASWVAYNDCVYNDGQFIADNVTTYAIGRSNPHPESGNLLDQSDGSDTGVTVTFSEFKTVGSLNWATDEAKFDKGSDADKIFGADRFTYASSNGTHKVAEDSVEFRTGVNNKGYVAQWKDIAPGEDGKIVIRTTHGQGSKNGGMADANEYKGYAAGIFMLKYQGLASVSPAGRLTTIWGKIKYE
jgi:hypothetical protein